MSNQHSGLYRAAAVLGLLAAADCARYVELGQLGLWSTRAALADGEVGIAGPLTRDAGRSRFVEDAQTEAREAYRDFLNGNDGNPAEHLGTAAGAIVTWFQWVRDACQE